MKLNRGSMNRAVIYFFYDGEGVVDRYVSYMLKDLKTCARDIYVVTNGSLTPEGRKTFLEFTDCVWERENKGLDVGAYRHALNMIGWDKLREYDEVVLMNHTIMGPVYPLREMFDEMGSRDLDFWGSNIYYRVGFDPYGIIECGYIREHLQSHFIVARKSLFDTEDYRTYWDTLPPINSYRESVAYHETYFTHHFAELGYKWDAYAVWDGLEDYGEYPLLRRPVELMKRARCPFFKRRNFIHDHYGDFLCATCGESTPELMRFLREETDYDVDMIWENILRTGNMADIVTSLDLTYVVPSGESEGADGKKAAFFCRISREDSPDLLLRYAAALPETVDCYIAVSDEEKEKEAEKAFEAIPNKTRIFRTKEKDGAAVLAGARDIIRNYEYICFARSPKDLLLKPRSQGLSWACRFFENTMGSPSVAENVIRLFEENPRLGLLTPAPPNHGRYYPPVQSKWAGCCEQVKQTAERLGLHAPMSEEKEPVAPLGAVFWFRSRAMEKLLAAGGNGGERSADHAGNGEEGSDLSEWLYPFVVQDAGYYPAWLFSDRGAAAELTARSYMVRGLARTARENGVKGAFHNEVCRDLSLVLGLEKDQQLTPVLYLDYGAGYSEEETLRVENWGEAGYLDADFDWPEEKGAPLRVRFDPCERGQVVLEDLSIFLLLPSGKKKALRLDACACNGTRSGDSVRFEDPDPWVDIPMKGKRKTEGLRIHARVSFYGE